MHTVRYGYWLCIVIWLLVNLKSPQRRKDSGSPFKTRTNGAADYDENWMASTIPSLSNALAPQPFCAWHKQLGVSHRTCCVDVEWTWGFSPCTPLEYLALAGPVLSSDQAYPLWSSCWHCEPDYNQSVRTVASISWGDLAHLLRPRWAWAWCFGLGTAHSLPGSTELVFIIGIRRLQLPVFQSQWPLRVVRNNRNFAHAWSITELQLVFLDDMQSSEIEDLIAHWFFLLVWLTECACKLASSPLSHWQCFRLII